MKKILSLCALFLLCALPASAEKLIVGASPAPHAEILRHIEPLLAEKGVELEIMEFSDYVLPNLALASDDIQANYFQHLPYLESFSSDRGLDLISAGSVHVEPMALFSKSYTDISAFKKGSTIAIPNDPTNGGRALLLLQAHGLIKLNDQAGLAATELDVVENPQGLVFKAMEAAQLPRSLDDVDGAIINGNYALAAQLDPRQALLVEGSESPYANVVAVRAGDEKKPAIKILLEVLQSSEVQSYIADHFKGAVLPAAPKH